MPSDELHLDSQNPNFSASLDSISLPDDDFAIPEGLDFSLDELLSFPSGDDGDLLFNSIGFPDDSKDGSGISLLPNDPCHRSSNDAVAVMGRNCSGSVSGIRCSGNGRVWSSLPQETFGVPLGSAVGDLPLDHAAGVMDGSDRGISGSDSVDRSSSPESFHASNTCLFAPIGGILQPDGLNALDSPDCSRGHDGDVSVSASGDGNSDVARYLDIPSPRSVTLDRGSLGERCSDAFVVLDSPSPDCGNAAQEFSGSSLDSSNARCGGSAATGCNIKLENDNKLHISKRKIGTEDGNTDSRTSKFRRSICTGDSNLSCSLRSGRGEDEKRQARLMRNRESAQLSRQRKKHYVEELEDKVRSMHSTIAELNNKISFIMAENASLRQQLSGSGVCSAPPSIYAPRAVAPVHFPWVPCSSYAFKPQGSQVPLVPIPRLKAQQPLSTSKSKKSDSKKAESKTKKAASVSLMGLLLFLTMLSGLFHITDVKFAGVTSPISAKWNLVSGGFDRAKTQGRIFKVSDHSNLWNEKGGNGLYAEKSNQREVDVEGNFRGSEGSYDIKSRVDGIGFCSNSSEPLAASLYVPRNDRLVKIDGNLIIHSVLAGEKAVKVSQASSKVKNSDASVSSDEEVKNGLAIAGNPASALAISKSGRKRDMHSRDHRNPAEHLKTLSSGTERSYGDDLKSSDGALQQWFQEGLAGPVLNSGVCTEMFQFDASPSANSGAIVPATSFNASDKYSRDSSKAGRRKNRRILHHPMIPLPGTVYNETQHAEKSPADGRVHGNKSISSSMVVSVLFDPKEAGDGDGDQVIAPKSLSRIFVVVLLDSVKYVTYSCVLPLKGSGTHVVAA